MVEVDPEALDAERSKELVTLHGKEAERLIAMSAEQLPVGDPVIEYVELDDGTIQRVATQELELVFDAGASMMATITCNHSGCNNNCSVTGCDPKDGGCTGATCTGEFCALANPTCSKSSSASASASALESVGF